MLKFKLGCYSDEVDQQVAASQQAAEVVEHRPDRSGQADQQEQQPAEELQSTRPVVKTFETDWVPER